MKGALVIFVAMVVIGIVLYLIDVFYYRKKYPAQPSNQNDAVPDSASDNSPNKGDSHSTIKTNGNINNGSLFSPIGQDGTSVKGSVTTEEDGGICCGMHTVCEKTNLSPLTGEIVYYDDEELDRFRGRDPESYTPEETEEFRDVLLTLLPEDVAGWSRSIQVREIPLPPDVRDELLLIVSELRTSPK